MLTIVERKAKLKPNPASQLALACSSFIVSGKHRLKKMPNGPNDIPAAKPFKPYRHLARSFGELRITYSTTIATHRAKRMSHGLEIRY